MRELRSAAGRYRAVERILGSGIVIRRKRSTVQQNKQQEPEPEPVVEQQQQQQQQDDDDYNKVDDFRELEEVEEVEENEGNMTPYEAPPITDQMSAKKQCLEKGLQRRTRLLRESSNSYAAEYDATNHNYEMYNLNHEASVPVDIPERENVKDVVVDSNNGKQKEKEKVARTSNAASLAEDEMRRATRLSGKRKAFRTITQEPNVEDHLIEAPEEFESSPNIANTNTRHEDDLIEAPEEFESSPNIVNTNTRHRNVIEYNAQGQPIGQFASELACYMGVLARQMVPIVHESWKEVPKTLKEKLWRCLEEKFVLRASSNKVIFSSIGNRWRVFKSILTNTYILPFKDEPDRLIHPPPKYNFIKQEHWEEFVKFRLSEAFQAIHEEKSEIRAKHIYPHRLGRTSYAGLVEKMIKNEGVAPEEIDRSVLWKKARQNKNGEYDDATREKLEIIDELKKQVDNGSLVCDGNVDVLTLALGTPESGRLRKCPDLGKCLKPNPQAAADKLREQQKLIENKLQEERVSRLQVEDQLLNTQNMVSRLEETLANFMQNGKSSSSISNKHPLVNRGNLGKDLPSVAAMIPSSNNEDLGIGPALTSTTMSPINNNGNLGRSLALTSNRVSMNNKEYSGKGPALTFTRPPLSNKENLGKRPASTSNSVHRENNVNLEKEPASTSNRAHRNINENLEKRPASTFNRVHRNSNENLEKGPASTTSNRVHQNSSENLGNSPASFSAEANSDNYEPSTSDSSQSRFWRNEEESLPVVQVTPPSRVARPVKVSRTDVDSSQSRFWRNDEESIPVVQVTPPSRVARPVKGSKVSRFQRFYNSMSQKLTGSIPFISVPVDTAVFGTDMELYLDLDDIQYICRMEDLSENCIMAYMRHLYDVLLKSGIQHKYAFINPASASAAKDADLSKIITSRLMNTNCEWVFIPINPEGSNWLLVAINLVAMSCYWLDPSGLPARYNIKPFVTFGLKGLQKGGSRRSSPIWYNVQCPKQKSSFECGFYIMKFMKEIIDDPSMFTRSEPFSKSAYGQDEIDEVRLEWIQTVEAHI